MGRLCALCVVRFRTWLAAALTAGVAFGLMGCDISVDKRRAVDNDGCVWEIWVHHNNAGEEKSRAVAWLAKGRDGERRCTTPTQPSQERPAP